MRPAASLSALILATLPLLGVVLGAALPSAAAVSDELKIPQAPAGSRPQRGMSMDKVQAAYGAPTRKVAAVGQPPIERWEYPAFTVYFEYQKVIHAVANP